MKRNYKFLIYISLIVLSIIVYPKNIYADNTCDKYQCITCEANLGYCNIKFDIKADGKGGASKPEFSQELNDKSVKVACKLEPSMSSSNFINSDNTSLVCPNKFFYTISPGNQGSITLIHGKIYFNEIGSKNEHTGELKETYNNNKSFKESGIDNSNYKSCDYTTTIQGNTKIKATVIYNNGTLDYQVDDGWKITVDNDITADMFKGDSCPGIGFSCFASGNNKYCTLSKENLDPRAHGELNNGTESNSSDDISKDETEEILNVELGENYECKDLQSTKTYAYIKDFFFLVQIIVPILLLIFGSLDFIKAVAAQNDDAMKKCQSSFVKRLIIAVVIFLMPAVLNLLFSFLTNAFEITTCGIGTEETTNSNK